MKLDPEEQIIGAALDQAELDDANERGAGARIEFKREGHAKVTITISREGQGARFDDRGALRRGDPISRPRRVRFSPSTSLGAALTEPRLNFGNVCTTLINDI